MAYKGRFLDVVGDLQIHLENAGFKPFDRPQSQMNKAVPYYEVDGELEGNGRLGDIYGWIVLRIYYRGVNDRIERADIEIKSSNSHPKEDESNQYTYDIDPADLDTKLKPYQNLR